MIGYTIAYIPVLFLFSVAIIGAHDKFEVEKKDSTLFMICAVVLIIVFSLTNGWLIKFKEQQIPLEQVEKAWEEYTIYCKENHISWSEETFPEWLEIEASLYD